MPETRFVVHASQSARLGRSGTQRSASRTSSRRSGRRTFPGIEEQRRRLPGAVGGELPQQSRAALRVVGVEARVRCAEWISERSSLPIRPAPASSAAILSASRVSASREHANSILRKVLEALHARIRRLAGEDRKRHVSDHRKPFFFACSTRAKNVSRRSIS